MERQKQKRILNAAQDLFGAHGFKRVAIDEIARKAGVSKGTVYNYAESKDELYFKVVEEELQAWVKECESKIDPKKPADQLMVEQGMHAFNYLDSKPTLRQMLVEDIDYSLTMWVDRLNHIRAQCASNGSRILQIGIHQGIFRPDLNVMQVALVLNDILINSLIMKYKRGVNEALMWAATAQDVILNGLKRKPE